MDVRRYIAFPDMLTLLLRYHGKTQNLAGPYNFAHVQVAIACHQIQYPGKLVSGTTLLPLLTELEVTGITCPLSLVTATILNIVGKVNSVAFSVGDKA